MIIDNYVNATPECGRESRTTKKRPGLSRILADEAGAVSPELVVLSAGVALIAILAVSLVSYASDSRAQQIALEMAQVEVTPGHPPGGGAGAGSGASASGAGSAEAADNGPADGEVDGNSGGGSSVTDFSGGEFDSGSGSTGSTGPAVAGNGGNGGAEAGGGVKGGAGGGFGGEDDDEDGCEGEPDGSSIPGSAEANC